MPITIPLIWLDNAATTQKPRAVIQAISHYYEYSNANVHRASHTLSARATHAFEDAREAIRQFINARFTQEIIWTRGATEALNLLAWSWGKSQLQAGDEIILSAMEHHANIVPWQQIAAETGAQIRVIPVNPEGELDLEVFEQLLCEKTRLLSITHASNALGTINPIKKMIASAKKVGAVTIVDGAQAVAHFPVDVQSLGCDFYVFSGHKVYGPTGIGVLYGRKALLETLPPWQTGGEMIERVSFSGTTFNKLPFRFEAGTPNIAGVVGMHAAIKFLMEQDRKALFIVKRPGFVNCWKRSLIAFPACAESAPPVTGLVSSLLLWMGFITRMSVSCWTSRVLLFVPVTTAPCP